MEVISEIAPLRKVILHPPGLALRRLTPDNCHDYLFDDVLWVEKAYEEHQQLVHIYQSAGVEVCLLPELLLETLKIPAARNWLLTKRLAQLYHQSSLVNELAHFLNEQDPELLVQYLLGGLTLKESSLRKSTLRTKLMKGHDFLLPPLPNHLFTRDTSFWVGNSVALGTMAYDSRVGESLNLAAIYTFHPMFELDQENFLFNGAIDTNLPAIEGGDVLVVNEECVLVGLSQRTTADGIEYLAKKLFAKSKVKKIFVLEIPKVRSCMHLDTVLTMVSHDIFATAFIKESHLRAWKILPTDREDLLDIEPVEDFFIELARALGLNQLKLINSKGDYFASKREQWNDAANLLAIAPNEVIAYKRNTRMNKKLRAAGVMVHEISSSELSRGRGGPRCMTCPVERG